MQIDEDYRDHDISVTTNERGQGTFAWEYVIDGEHRTTSRDRPLASEKLAAEEGLRSAKAVVDGWLEREGRMPRK